MSRSSFLMFSIIGCLSMLVLQLGELSLSNQGMNPSSAVEWLLVDTIWLAMLAIGLFPALTATANKHSQG
ncbi:hypothetical protein [Photobacterium aquae]|nr:hypothetical protein [Photobacterium aquae]